MAPLDLDLPDELEVGLFPLPGVVLFPGMALPLLVFEARYRALVASALKGDRLLAVPRLVPGHDSEYLGNPPVFPTCGIGRIVDDVRLPDGRYRILVNGVARASLLEERDEPPFRLARARVLRSVEPEPRPALLTLRATVLAHADRLIRSQHNDPERFMLSLREASTLASLSDLVAATLVADDDVRQQLLEEGSVAARFELLLGHLHAVLWKLQPQEPQGALN
jgi:Lon protease-like protein